MLPTEPCTFSAVIGEVLGQDDKPETPEIMCNKKDAICVREKKRAQLSVAFLSFALPRMRFCWFVSTAFPRLKIFCTL